MGGVAGGEGKEYMFKGEHECKRASTQAKR